MRLRSTTRTIFAAVAATLWADLAHADIHALICHSVSEAKQLVRIVDQAPKPMKIGDVLANMRAKGVKCTVVFAEIEFKAVVETVTLPEDDYEIVRVTVNDREFFTFKRQKGTRA